MTENGRIWPWQNKDAQGWQVALQAFHVAFGLLCAALVPTILFSSIGGPITGLIAFIIAGGHAALLGFPLAAVGAWRGMITVWTAVIGGIIVGALPIGVSLVPVTSGHRVVSLLNSSDFSSSPHALLAAWAICLACATGAGAFGAVSGVGFWFGWKWIRGKVPASG